MRTMTVRFDMETMDASALIRPGRAGARKFSLNSCVAGHEPRETTG
jgi:hypothetical protein